MNVMNWGTMHLAAFFFFKYTATTEIYTLSYTLSLHDALPISRVFHHNHKLIYAHHTTTCVLLFLHCARSEEHTSELQSHSELSYAVFCVKKKKDKIKQQFKRNGLYKHRSKKKISTT